jgi:hypothetical protein
MPFDALSSEPRRSGCLPSSPPVLKRLRRNRRQWLLLLCEVADSAWRYSAVVR